ncbi:MAG: adenylate/guanylate cyclase domain-containing protein [Armatimonadota bacterium]
MASKIKVICFTDLKGSTDLFEKLGHNGFLPHLQEHLNVGKCLAESVGGRYIKNVGDAHVVEYEVPEEALAFALSLQQYYRELPCVSRPPLAVKVGLFLGVVESTAADIFGSAVNQAARVQGKAQPGEVIVNSSIVDAMKKIWGVDTASTYFSSAGKHELKGIADPPEQELFYFDWERYGTDNPELGLCKLVYEHLQQAKVEPSNLESRDLASPGVVIWPVVPRNIVTAIHRGQTEIIRLLAMLGWKVELLIADCGAQDNYSRTDSEKFRSELMKYLESRGVGAVDSTFLSDLYDPLFKDYDKVQTVFRKIASELTLQDLLDINNKAYNSEVKEEISKSATLDCLRPALSLAAVLYKAEVAKQKCIVVAGLDEHIQWVRTHSIPGTQNMLGVLMNPVLKTDPTHQARQKGFWPSWPSWNEMVRNMDGTNLAYWTFHMHAYLPSFPEQHVMVGGAPLYPSNWNDEMGIPDGMNRDDLAKCVWQILGPNA